MQHKNSISWILLKNSSKNSRFCKKGISWIFNSIALNLYYTGSFIWGISFHNLKYLDKPIKCLEMRAKIKSVRKFNEIFLYIFTYIQKSDIFPHTSIFTKNVCLVIFKYQNFPSISNFWHLSHVIWCSLDWVVSIYLVAFIKNTLYEPWTMWM